MDFLLVIVGLALLMVAGDALVRGAVALSLRIGLPAFVVSATVVAFGTSAPELLISVQAALEGAPGIALGNVVGSNIANVWLVLGIPAVIVPIASSGEGIRALWFMLVATAIFTILLLSGTIFWWGGLLLLAMAGLMVADSIRHGLRAHAAGCEVEDLGELEEIDPQMARWKIGALIAGGLIGLPLGAQFLIDGARGIALDFGISEAVVGLTIVAVGTSLPELATSVIAAIRGQADVAMGNVLGSNLFNITAIIGTAALFAPLGVPAEMIERDIWVMIAATLMLAPYVLMRRLVCRWTGAIFLAFYVVYVSSALAA